MDNQPPVQQAPQPAQQPPQPPSKGYGKRPLWQWIVIYVVIGGILYGAIYYFAIAKKGGYGTTNSGNQNTSQRSY